MVVKDRLEQMEILICFRKNAQTPIEFGVTVKTGYRDTRIYLLILMCFKDPPFHIKINLCLNIKLQIRKVYADFNVKVTQDPNRITNFESRSYSTKELFFQVVGRAQNTHQ